MGTINHTYDPNQDVYVINTCDDKPFITNGTIVRVRASVLVTETTIVYDVRLDGMTGTIELTESDIFADKPTAVAEYSNRV